MGIMPKFVSRTIGYMWEEAVLPVMRWSFFDERVFRAPGSKVFLDSLKYVFKAVNIKFLRDRLPELDPKKSELSWLPINKQIDGMGEITLPEEVLFRFIEKAEHRVIVNCCGCRAANRCKHYPDDIGCLMMGESAKLIPKKTSREVDMEEAKEHVRKAIAAGLIPITGKARIDNDIFMIPDKGKLLTVCFCCECCCVTRFSRYVDAEAVKGLISPVEGLSIEITDDCTGCGACIDKCYVDAIQIEDEKAEIGERCCVCGRCALYCPNRAIRLTAGNPNAAEDVIARIEAAVDF